MKVNYEVLESGLTIVTDQMDVQTTSIGVWIGSGNCKEELNECGIAHMLEHMAFKGTVDRNAEEIAREIEDVGGDINAYTSKEVTAYYLKVLHENSDLGIDILADIIKNSTLPDEEIERERGVILSEIGQSFDAPDDRVFENFTATAFSDQSIGRPILGTRATVSNFQRSDLQDFFSSHYGLKNMVVVASGNVNEKFFLESVKDKFSDVKHKVKPTHLEAKWIGGFKGEDRDLEQTQLVFGIEGLNNIDVDRYALRALAIILGGGMSSRLFQELREKRGLCYSIFSFTQMQSSSGVFGFYAGTSPKDGNQLLEASLCEWNKLKGSISEDEVLRAKAQMRSGFIMGQESTGSRAEYLAKNILTFGKLKSTEQVLREIDKVSVNSVEEVIARIFSVSKPVLSVIGPDALSYEGFNINSSIN